MLWSIIKNIARKPAGVDEAAAERDFAASGMACFEAGDFAAACRHLNAAHAADPGDGDVLYYLALAEARSGGLERARTLLETLCAQRDDADVNNALGNVHRLGGRLADAAASYQRAVDADDGHLAAARAA